MVYRITHPTEDMHTGFNTLAATGVDVVWISSNPKARTMGFGWSPSKPGDSRYATTLTSKVRSLVECAEASGLRVMIDMDDLRSLDTPTSDGHPSLPHRSAIYRWTDARTVAASAEAQVSNAYPEVFEECSFDSLRIARCMDWVQQACRAPVAHADMARVYRSIGKEWPLWLIEKPSAFPAGGANMVEPSTRIRLLALALPLCLKGTPVYTQDADAQHPPLPIAISHFLLWKRTVPALRIGKMRLLSVHDHILMFVRQNEAQRVLCVFNLSDRYVRHPLPPELLPCSLIAGSGLDGGRIVNGHIDCDPWGALFAQLHETTAASRL